MSKIRAIRERLHRAESSHRRRDPLWKERTEIEEKIHTTAANQVGSLLHLSEETQALKTKKLEIDHLLDEIEEENGLTIQRLREDFISTLLDIYPEESVKFELFEIQRRDAEELLLKIQIVIDHSQRVANSLGLALGTWERPLMVRILR